MLWYWLSFADPAQPRGKQWLGGCFVTVDARRPETQDERDALFLIATRNARAIGCNPGGAVQGSLLDAGVEPPLFARGRLLSMADSGHAGRGEASLMDSYPYLLQCPCEHCVPRHPVNRAIYGAHYISQLATAIALIGAAQADPSICEHGVILVWYCERCEPRHGSPPSGGKP